VNQVEREVVSRATIYEVAERAGVSIATVSRVINGYDRIRPSTREQVLQAIDQLSFVPNNSARGLSFTLNVAVQVGIIREIPFLLSTV